MNKRLLAVLLCLVLLVGLMPFGAFAVSNADTAYAAATTGSAAAADVTSYLAFSSDVHNSSNNTSANRLNTWINNVTAKTGKDIDVMSFCGDNGSASAGESDFWTYTQTVMNTVNSNSHVKDSVFTTGNHEHYNGNFNSTSNSTAKNIKRIGEAKNAADYIIYAFGPKDWANSTDQFYTDDLSTLDSYLAGLTAADQQKPIFILSHFPAHTFSGSSGSSWGGGWSMSRSTRNADQLISTLNKYGEKGYDIYFLWGHNHTVSDTHYDEVFTGSLDGTAIKFTYLAAGCMSDSEYGTGSAFVKGKGLLIGINNKKVVSINYYDANGNDVTEQGGSTTPTAQPTTAPSGTTPVSGKQYLIVCDGHALTTAAGESYSNGGSSSSGTYNYTGLAGTTYTSGMTVSSDMVWTFTSSGSGFVISNNGKYLNGYYESNSSGGSNGDLKLESSQVDVWTLSGDTLKSTNASSGASSDKYLAYGNGDQASVNTFSVRSAPSSNNSNVDNTLTFIEVQNGSVVEPTTAPTTQPTTTPATGDQYVIVIDGHALTTAPGDSYDSSSSSSYHYTGLAGKAYTEGMTVTDDMLWTFTPSGNGYLISNNGKYLNGTYTSSNGVTTGALNLNSTQDVWILSGDTLKSTNASSGQSSDKFLAYGNGDGTNVNTFSIRSAPNSSNNYVDNDVTLVKVGSVTPTTEPTTQPTTQPGTDTQVAVTPVRENPPEVSATIKVGDTLSIKVTNSSTYSDYDFTATLSNSGVAQLASSVVNIKQGSTGTFTVTGLKAGTADIKISNSNSYDSSYNRVATIHLTVIAGTTPTVEPTVEPSVEPTTTPVPSCTHPQTAISGKKAATCTEDGYTGDTVCLKCGEIVTKGEVIPAKGHDTELRGKKDATCTEDGYTGDYVCKVCGETIAKGSVIKAEGHDTVLRNAKAATCETEGYTGDEICKVCGETVKKGEVIPATGHAWDDGTITKAATCTEDGVMTFVCKTDASHTKTEVIPAKGHTLVAVPGVAATEDAEGMEPYWKCSECGKLFSDAEGKHEITAPVVIPKLDHTHNLTKVAGTPATCTEPGVEDYWKCAKCGAMFSDAEGTKPITAPVVIAALGHDTELKNAKDATCTEDGYTGDEVCKVCGETIKKGEVIAALGHDTELKNAKDATCTEPGYTGDLVCKVCGEVVKAGEVIEAKGHDTELKNAKDATCEEAGYTGDLVCKVCGEVVKAGEVIEAKGHELVKHDAKAPTETEPGNIEYWECSECHKLFSDKDGKNEIKLEDTVVPATGKQPCDGGENCPSIHLVDVDRSNTAKGWYHLAVDWAVVNNITNGTDDSHFSPNAACTREQMVTFLWRMNGSPEPDMTKTCPFTDLREKDYSYKAILWAYQNNITNGTSETTFSPRENVTREQVVTLLWRLAGSEKVDGTVPFTDIAASRYSFEAVKWAVKEGITDGRTPTTFAPYENCTRAEIVTFLWRSVGKPLV